MCTEDVPPPALIVIFREAAHMRKRSLRRLGHKGTASRGANGKIGKKSDFPAAAPEQSGCSTTAAQQFSLSLSLFSPNKNRLNPASGRCRGNPISPSLSLLSLKGFVSCSIRMPATMRVARRHVSFCLWRRSFSLFLSLSPFRVGSATLPGNSILLFLPRPRRNEARLQGLPRS